MTASQPVHVEELLAQREWVRRFAAALVRDPNDADDLAQDAFASALRTPPRAGTSLRSWFAAVMRNRVRDLARHRSVAEGSVRHVARDAAAGLSPAELTERAETERLVISLVLELPEDFRDAVLMRFWRGMEPAEIAALRGIPAATVRTRVHRGLAEVREKLGRRDRDCRWKAVLLGVPPDGVRQTPCARTWATRWVTAAAVVALAVGAVWMWTPGTGANGPSPDTTTRSTTTQTPRVRGAGGTRGTERAEAAEPPADPADGGAPSTPPATREVTVRVTGPGGAAVAGVELWALSAAPVKDVTTRVVHVRTSGGAVRTSEDGAARFAWPYEPGPGRVLARAGALCGVSQPLEMPADVPVEIRLEASWVLAGHVADEEGLGIAGASLHLECDFDGSLASIAVAMTDPSGRFEFGTVPRSLAERIGTLEVRADGFATEWLARKEWQPSTDAPRIVMRRSLELTGRVVDERGRALGGVEVDFSTGDNTFTGDDGRFRSGRLRAEEVRISVLSDEHAAASLAIGDPAPGLRDVGDIVLRAGEPVRGRVLFADGSIAAGVWVGVEDTSVSQFVRQGQADREGRFAFEHLGPGPLELHSNGPSEGLHAGSIATVKDVRPGPDEVVITLGPGRSIVVSLTDADTGRPVTADHVVVAVKPEDGGAGAATSLFDTRDGATSVRVSIAREGAFLVTVKVSGFEDFGPERVVVASGNAPLDAKLRKR